MSARAFASFCVCTALVVWGCEGAGNAAREDAGLDASVAAQTAGARADAAARVLDAGAIAVGTGDAGGSTDASASNAERRHVCYVYDDCNGGRNNDVSASACPMWEPTLGDDCALARGQYCYYCDPAIEARHWWEWIPRYSCSDTGLWEVNSIAYACE